MKLLNDKPTLPSSRTNNAEATRADILAVATEHFARSGLSGARIEEIADQTRTSKRMLYYHFASKEGLYRAVLARSYADLRKLESQLDLDGIDPEQALRFLIELTFDYHRLHPDFVRLVMAENMHGGAHIEHVDGIDTRAEAIMLLLGKVLERGVAAGKFRSGLDPLDLHLSISALCFYNVSNRHSISRIFGRDPQAKAVYPHRRAVIVDTVLRWVLARPPIDAPKAAA